MTRYRPAFFGNPNRLIRRSLVYLVFVDDSEREAKDLQLAAAVVIPADKFHHVERDFGYLIQTELGGYPQVLNNPTFEFHAAAI
jgi:hypothetical protein